MKPVATPINAVTRVHRPVPAKAIYWPTAAGYGDSHLTSDSTRFPQLQAMKARIKSEPPAPLDVFTKAVSDAQARVFVIDEYLFNPKTGTRQQRIEQILDWFPETFSATDVRMLSASSGDKETDESIATQFLERAALINSIQAYPEGIRIGVKFTLTSHFPYVHDRFAIVDDELWHFGATIGGLHGPLNAASRGWFVDDHQAVEFFEAAWRGDQGAARNHDS